MTTYPESVNTASFYLLVAAILGLMTVLCIFVPSMINQSSLLMIPCGALALIIGFVLFKKGRL